MNDKTFGIYLLSQLSPHVDFVTEVNGAWRLNIPLIGVTEGTTFSTRDEAIDRIVGYYLGQFKGLGNSSVRQAG